MDEIVYLKIDETLKLSTADLKLIYDKDIEFDMSYTFLDNRRLFKVNLSKLSSVNKLKWLQNARNVIDYSATNKEILASHIMPQLQNLIENEIIKSKTAAIKYADLNLKFGSFLNYSYDFYLQFDNVVINIDNIHLIRTIDLINMHSTPSSFKNEYYFSIPFFKAISEKAKTELIDFYFVMIKKEPADTYLTLALKAKFLNNISTEYYDFSYNPPLGGSVGFLTSDIGSPLSVLLFNSDQ